MGKRTVPGARLLLVVQLQGRRPAAEGRVALRRRTQPPAPGQAAQERRQPAAAGRADQRPRRRHAARARRGAGQLRRLRGRDQPRPLVPRPHRHAHPRVRRRQPGGVVRGELPGLRGRPEAAPRRRGGPAAPDQVPEADAVDAVMTANDHEVTKPRWHDDTKARRRSTGLDGIGPSCHRASSSPSWLWALSLALLGATPSTRRLRAPFASTTTTPAPRPPRCSPSTGWSSSRRRGRATRRGRWTTRISASTCSRSSIARRNRVVYSRGFASILRRVGDDRRGQGGGAHVPGVAALSDAGGARAGGVKKRDARNAFREVWSTARRPGRHLRRSGRAAVGRAGGRAAEERRPGHQGRSADPGRRLHRRRAAEVRERRAAAGGHPVRVRAVQGAQGRLQRLGAVPAGCRVRHLAPVDRRATGARRSAPPTTRSAPSATC